jgi:hypothetical protein
MAQEIKKLLEDLFNIQDNWKCKLLNNWTSIIGSLASQVCVEKIEDETLTLGVRDSCWLQELHLLSPLLLKEINNKLDQPRIKKLRFKAMTHIKHNRAAKTKNTNTNLHSRALSHKEQAALNKIEDTQLQSVLQRFLMRCSHE